MDGIVSTAWNQLVQLHNLQLEEPREDLGDDKLWKHRLTVKGVGFGVGSGKTKLEAREAAQVYIFQRYYHDVWNKMVAQLNHVSFSVKGDRLVLEEGGHVEFKGSKVENTSWDFAHFKSSFKEEAGRTICAFLNADSPGGVMYFGVHDSGIIQGIVLSQDDRDKLNLLVDHLYKRFDPPVGREQVRLEWKKVDSADQENLYLVVLKVASGGGLDTFWFDHVVYERHNASTVKMPPAKIRQRIQQSLVAKLQNLKP